MSKSKRAGCDCPSCRELCTNESGWFIPEEIPIAAKYLGISEQDFIRDYLEAHVENNIMAYSPKMVKGRCIFLEKGLCKIHPVKPYECRKVYGCEEGRRHKRIRDIILKMWR